MPDRKKTLFRSGDIFLIPLFILSCSKPDQASKIHAQWRSLDRPVGESSALYPEPGTLFPPEMAPPLFKWNDVTPGVEQWLVLFSQEGDIMLHSQFISDSTYRPDPVTWEKIKRSAHEKETRIVLIGVADGRIVSSCGTTFSISRDSLGAPIFFRSVPLPFEYALNHLDEIKWHLADISSSREAPVLLENIPLCANCHSFTRDGGTLAMDVDYANDKGSYIVSEITSETVLEPDKIISWSDYRREDGQRTFGLLSQISPDGRYVISTLKDRSIFVPKDNVEYSQLFFPIKGILVVYDRVKNTFFPLPGADDANFVQSNPCWSPDSETVYFAKAPVYHHVEAEKSSDIVLATEMASEFINGERDFKYDIYSVPFNNGKGGKAELLTGACDPAMSDFFPRISPDGKWIVFCRASNFMLLQPDSKLYIMPARGGIPRLMRCNSRSMNSWHSWSPNSRWLVFASKKQGAFTQLYLTHIDEKGMDTPPVLIENAVFERRACNIPEFVNLGSKSWTRLVDAFSNQSHYYFTRGRHLLGRDRFADAIHAFDRAHELDPSDPEPLRYKANTQFLSGMYRDAVATYDKALALDPENPSLCLDKATSLFELKEYNRAIQVYSRAIDLDPDNAYGLFARGSARAKAGDLVRALDDFNAAISMGYQREEAFYERGLTKALLKRFEGAAQDFQAVVEINPQRHQAWAKLGTSLYQLKNYQQAIEAYSRAIRIKPEAEIYSYRGFCYAAVNEMVQAIEDYSQAIRLNRRSAIAYYHRGLLRIRSGDKQKGCQDLLMARDLGSGPAVKMLKKHCNIK